MRLLAHLASRMARHCQSFGEHTSWICLAHSRQICISFITPLAGTIELWVSICSLYSTCIHAFLFLWMDFTFLVSLVSSYTRPLPP